jgi:selenocysteine lyase/cysteine desulfurase
MHLNHQLQHARDMGASIIIGAFAAGLTFLVPSLCSQMVLTHSSASNVTGALADVHAVTAVLHSHAALAGFFHLRLVFLVFKF